MLYPKIDSTRPNLHAAKAVMKKPYVKKVSPEKPVIVKEKSKSKSPKNK